jgi:hypothetical protein
MEIKHQIILYVYFIATNSFFFQKAMSSNEDLDGQKTISFTSRDRCSNAKQVNDVIKTIFKLNINETLSENNHRVHCYKQELCNRAVHTEYS